MAPLLEKKKRDVCLKSWQIVNSLPHSPPSSPSSWSSHSVRGDTIPAKALRREENAGYLVIRGAWVTVGERKCCLWEPPEKVLCRSELFSGGSLGLSLPKIASMPWQEFRVEEEHALRAPTRQWNLHFDPQVKHVFSHSLFTTNTHHYLSGREKASLSFQLSTNKYFILPKWLQGENLKSMEC